MSGVQFNGGNLGRAGLSGVNAKTAGIAADIQNLPAGGETGRALPVLALVAEKAGLIARLQVHLKLYAVLGYARFYASARARAAWKNPSISLVYGLAL